MKLTYIKKLIFYLKWKDKLTILDVLEKLQMFYSTTRIVLMNEASRSNIQITSATMVYGSLYSIGKGTIKIGKYSQVGPNSKIMAVTSISIGDYVAIGPNVIVTDNNNHPVNPYDRILMQKTRSGSFMRSPINSSSSPIIIEDNVWIGENSRVCKNVRIGYNSVIGANSVVTKDIAPNCVAVGNPAKIVKTEIDKTTPRFFE